MSPITRRWQRDLDQAEWDREMRSDHIDGKHVKLPRQSCPLCKADRAAQWQKNRKPTEATN